MTSLALDNPTVAQPPPRREVVMGGANAELTKPELDISKKTSGEKFYDVFQFITGKVFIVAITAVLAFAANPTYAKDSYFGVPNLLKKFQIGMSKMLKPMFDKGGFSERFAGAATSTMILSWGGNFFSPFIKWLENERESIANYWNRKFGKKDEVEIAHERLKDTPKQDWGDVIKGRAISWGLIFSGFLGIDTLLGKDKKGPEGKYYFDKYEDWFGRLVAGFTKEGKEIRNTPIAKELTEVQKANKAYRFGKVIALDLYATTLALFVWNFFSRKSAKRKDEAKKSHEHALAAPVEAQPQTIEETSPTQQQDAAPNFTSKFFGNTRPHESYAQAVALQKQEAAAEMQPKL